MYSSGLDVVYLCCLQAGCSCKYRVLMLHVLHIKQDLISQTEAYDAARLATCLLPFTSHRSLIVRRETSLCTRCNCGEAILLLVVGDLLHDPF